MALTMRVALFLAINACLAVLCQGWKVSMTYSLDGKTYNNFGDINVIQKSDGNFTGSIEPTKNLGETLATKLKEAVKQNPKALYYIQAGPLLTSNSACALLKANLAHDFAVTIDHEHGDFLSITIYPRGIYDASAEDFDCSTEGTFEAYKPRLVSNVIVTSVKELPSPETAAYLQRIEEEKRARQHGAAQDNRGFLAKYWMYIVPLALFMIVSSVMTGDEGQ
uniref:ER membrane protein complex subunit 10 n=1 Tax=Panagrellus redivivus TaxID=6233 RepID=A0A7E4VNJ6_PANRE